MKRKFSFSLFANEKLVSDKPAVIPSIPEYPVWMKQPENNEPDFMMRPVKIKGSAGLDAFYIALIAGSLLAMGVIDWMQHI